MPLRATLAALAVAASWLLAPPARAADANGDLELAVLQLINVERANNGLPALLLDMGLDEAAEVQSLDMATTPCFQHDSCDGTNWADRIQTYYTAPATIGEIIAAGYTTPAAVVNGWMNSPGHRANILGSDFVVAGVGLAYGGTYGSYWTVDFGGQITSATVAVPEPGTWALMGLGLCGMAVAVRRQRFS
jgi:uncharacterized protein YkwD